MATSIQSPTGSLFDSTSLTTTVGAGGGVVGALAAPRDGVMTSKAPVPSGTRPCEEMRLAWEWLSISVVPSAARSARCRRDGEGP
ncbi:MAG: hypothetical protein QM621_02240 [Aeromicrobium sp.]|uniref:hypothetical protein n=1 Tax=Aeromicrobium sp. TaxID=1871063 RepID=UPI0039E58B98